MFLVVPVIKEQGRDKYSQTDQADQHDYYYIYVLYDCCKHKKTPTNQCANVVFAN